MSSNTSGCDDRVVVAVRSRALQGSEASGDVAVQVKDASCEVYAVNRGRFPFTFDFCFDSVAGGGSGASQEAVFETIGRPLVDHAFGGFNASIIAYGPTGSGKTYSIFGREKSLGSNEEGLIPRVCNEIFHRVDQASLPPANDQPVAQRTVPTRHSVRVSVLEIYLEEVFDLLCDRKPLRVRSEGTNRFGVPGLRWVEVDSYDDIVHLLQKAEEQKTFAATAIHERSSRAHTLFQLELRSSTVDQTRTSRIVLADLAGSERVKEARTDSGRGLQQATSINMSLLTLGTCIEAVVRQSKTGATGVAGIGEFRNSALTKLLRDYIGGNSRTAMLVTVAPTLDQVSHTLQALRFADRAKQLTNHAEVNSRHVEPAIARVVERRYGERHKLIDDECKMEIHIGHLANRQTQLEGTLATLAHRALSSNAAIRTDAERQRTAIETELAQVTDSLDAAREAADEVRVKLAQFYSSDAWLLSAPPSRTDTPRSARAAGAQQTVGTPTEQMTAELDSLRAFAGALRHEKDEEAALRSMELAALRAEYEARLEAQQSEFDSVVENSTRCLSQGIDKVRLQADTDRALLSTRVEELEAEVGSTRAQLVTLEEDAGASAARIHELEQRLAASQEDAFRGAARAVEAEADLERTRESLRTQTRSCDELASKADRAGEDIASLKEERARLRDSATQLREQLVNTQLELTAGRAEAQESQSLVKSLRRGYDDELQRAHQRASELEQQLAAARDAADEALSAAQSRTATLENALVESDVRVAESEEALARMANELESAMDQLQTQKGNAEAAATDAQTCRARVSDLEEELTGLTNAHRAELSRMRQGNDERTASLEAKLRLSRLGSLHAAQSLAMQCAAAKKAIDTAVGVADDAVAAATNDAEPSGQQTAVPPSHEATPQQQQQQTTTRHGRHNFRPSPSSTSGGKRVVSTTAGTPPRRSAQTAPVVEEDAARHDGDADDAPSASPEVSSPSPAARPSASRASATTLIGSPPENPTAGSNLQRAGSGPGGRPSASVERTPRSVFGGSPSYASSARRRGAGPKAGGEQPGTVACADLLGSPERQRPGGPAPLSVMKENANTLFA